MSDLFSPTQIRAALESNPLFGSVTGPSLDRLVAMAVGTLLPAGETLIREGDPPGDVFVLVSGRLEAWVERDGDVKVVVGEVGPGEVVGEMSAFSEMPRSATVTARRDCTLLRLPRVAFHDLMVEDAPALLAMTRLLAHRVETANRAEDRGPQLRTVALVPVGAAHDGAEFVAALAAAFDGPGAELITRARVVQDLGADAPDAARGTPAARRLAEYLHDLEVGGSVVLLVADREPTPWTDRCIGQSDRALIVASGGAVPPSTVEQHIFDTDEAIRPPVDLVLVHVAATGALEGTAGWLEGRPVQRHHHVFAGDAPSLARMVRRLRGVATGLVLSGGGARGMAHIGVIRALREAGVEFDMYGGASFGSSVAAMAASGWTVDRILDGSVKATVDPGSLLDVTFPYMSLAKGHTLTHSINETFGDAVIEDMPLPFFCVSSDLTAGRLRVHDRGRVAYAVRASVAIPGIFPPMRSPEGHVLVDGGIMDNLPIAEMRRRLGGGTVVAVDLRTRNELPSAEMPGGGEASGWPPLVRRFNPVRPRMELPRMIDLLIRSTELASGDRHDIADVTFRPPLEGFGLLEFTAYEAIVEAGYRYAADLLERNGSLLDAPGR